MVSISRAFLGSLVLGVAKAGDFDIYGASVCARNLFGDTTGFWMARFSDTEECTRLPPWLFNRITRWVDIGQTKEHLIFSLDLEGSYVIELDLSKSCIRSSNNSEKSIYPPIGAVTTSDPIIFSRHTRSTESNEMVEDSDESVDRKGCRLVSTCIGQQNYFEPGNICKNPDCESFFLLKIDEETKICKFGWRSHFLVLFAIFLTTLQIISLRLRQYLTKRIFQ
jgi:hypothetical protein